ncbi:MAG: DUF5667 domain-containing protein [Anaerolineae bacterium]|jgi:hypothetical protein
MNVEFDSILEQSLSQIAAGKARVESCLVSYPAMADQLEPLLRAAETLRTMPKPALSPEAKARIEDRVLDAAKKNPGLRGKGVNWPWRRFPKLRWALGGLAILLVMMVVSTTLLQVSAAAMPGTPLYHVKLAVEDVWLWLTPADGEPALHLKLARRRMEELEALAAQGAFDPIVLSSMVSHTEAALVGAESLPDELAVQVLDDLVILTQEQEAVLTRVSEIVPGVSRGRLVLALQTVTAQAGRAQSLLGILGRRLSITATPTATATVTSSRMPTATGVAGGTVTPTATDSSRPTEASSPSTEQEPVEGPSDEPVVPTGTSPPSPRLPSPTPEPSEMAQPTEHIPPGLINTPHPPAHGLTKTPKPDK